MVIYVLLFISFIFNNFFSILIYYFYLAIAHYLIEITYKKSVRGPVCNVTKTSLTEDICDRLSFHRYSYKRKPE